jgi:hypothetical protein
VGTRVSVARASKFSMEVKPQECLIDVQNDQVWFSLQQDLRKMETDSKSSPANPDIKLVTIDVKMQIRTLHAVCKQSLAIPNLNS